MGYLVADGVNDYCTIPNALTGNAGTDAYTIEFRAAFPTTPAGTRFLIGVGSGTSSNGFGIMTTGAFSVFAGGSARYSAAAGFIIFDTTFRTYRLEHDAGGAWRAYRDGSLISSGTYATSNAFVALGLFFRIHPTSTGYIACNLEYCTVTGLGNSASWQADLSGGTGSTLPTVGGTNNATLINFPTDNSQWQGFSSAVTSTIAYSVDGFTFSASATSAAPTTSATINYSVDGFVFAASSAVTTPPNTASISYSLDGFTYSASARVSNSSVVAYDVGAINYAASALVVSNISTTVSYDVGTLAFSVVATAPQNEPERGLVTKNNPYWRNSIFFNTSRRY